MSKLLTWPKNNNTFDIDVLRVLDGDTFRCIVELPFYVRLEMDCRITGINANELDEPGGPEAREALEEIFIFSTVVVQSMKPDKFSGRFDARVLVIMEDGHDPSIGEPLPPLDVGEQLVKAGWAVRWNGVGKKPKVPWPRVSAG